MALQAVFDLSSGLHTKFFKTLYLRAIPRKSGIGGGVAIGEGKGEGGVQCFYSLVLSFN